jgi:PPK2 family polyphosphate:nucleotide phosphotransferase
MASFKPYRVNSNGKFKLSKVDPGDTPFAQGSEDQQREQLTELAIELDKLQNRLHAEGRRKVPLGERVIPFKVPSELERAHDFLWRCHAVVPGSGQLMIWNRSHYEDVLVPVVEELIDKKETQRRYRQINDFERLLVETGTTVIKCMLHISSDEQRTRLQERIDTPGKQWKFSRGDLAVREKWDAYQSAYEKALAATSTGHAPWHVIPADSKVHRNLMIAQLLVRTLKDMKLQLPPADPALKGLVVR